MATLDLLPAMTERIVRRVAPLQVILFGSYARGEASPRSDVDLLVVVPDGSDRSKLASAIAEELRDFHASADTIITTPDEIAHRGDLVGTVLRPALRDGKVLYARETGDCNWTPLPVSDEDVWREVGNWLTFAQDDLAAADWLLSQPELSGRQAGYSAQQTVEKALKAVYIFLQVQYPFTHVLDELRNGLPDDWQLKYEFPLLKEISEWAIAQRYPGAKLPTSAAGIRVHVSQARALLTAVRRDLYLHGYPDKPER